MRNIVGPEHTALMTFDQLQAFLVPRFAIVAAKGYCASRHPSVDDELAHDEATLRAAVYAHEERPDLRIESRTHGYPQGWVASTGAPCRGYEHDDPALRVFGRWDEVALFGPLTGISTSGASCDCLEFASFATTIYLFLWAQPQGRARGDLR